MKRIVFSDQAKTDIRAIPQQTAMQILTLFIGWQRPAPAELRHSRVRADEKRLRVGDFRVRFTVEGGKENEGTLHIHSVRNRKEAYR